MSKFRCANTLWQYNKLYEWATRGTIVLIFGERIGNPRAYLNTIRKADAPLDRDVRRCCGKY